MEKEAINLETLSIMNVFFVLWLVGDRFCASVPVMLTPLNLWNIGWFLIKCGMKLTVLLIVILVNVGGKWEWNVDCEIDKV